MSCEFVVNKIGFVLHATICHHHHTLEMDSATSQPTYGQFPVHDNVMDVDTCILSSLYGINFPIVLSFSPEFEYVVPTEQDEMWVDSVLA